jgi:cytochrome P460
MPYRFLLVAAMALIVGGIITLGAFASESGSAKTDASRSPVFGVTLPEGYRHWQAITVAHEAGNNNDIRVILGNDIAMKAFRAGTVPYPDGTIIARLAWKYESSARNNAIFGRDQSFVAGDPTNVQISVKDSKRFASTDGWGYAQFENDGKANQSVTLVNACYACHKKLPAETDLVFSSYSK